MPELPEVTTIVSDINQNIAGKRIDQVKITSLGENLRIKSRQDLDQKLAGKKIEKAERVAKFLVLELSNGDKLVIHMKLTGQFILKSKDARVEEFTRLVIELDDSSKVFFNDRNGAAEAFIVEDISQVEKLVGPDPFEIKPETFADNIQKSDKKTIKETIVDQKVIVGVGNIYADEALFVAKINPTRPPKSLTAEEVNNLLDGIKQVLTEGIEHRGTTIDSYRDLLGNPGTHQNYLRVYGKKGQPCPNCGTKIEYMEINGRRTHFCPACQPAEQLSLF